MPNFILRHGCCYIPPQESVSSTTCEVFSNPDYSSRTSHEFSGCDKGKSSPEFAAHYKEEWDYLNPEDPSSSRSSDEEHQHNHNFYLSNDHNVSLHTIYGNKTRAAIYDSDKLIQHSPVSDSSNGSNPSYYAPSNVNYRHCHITNTEKFLDCVSTCLWKCSSWCQRI